MSRQGIAITFTELHEAEALKLLGGCKEFSILVNRTGQGSDSVPTGTVTPLENVNGHNARRTGVTEKGM